MLSAAIIVFREALEAALIMGIIAAATRRLPKRNFWLLIGCAAGVAGSLIVASLTGQIAGLAEGVGQELFNAGILGLAAMMLAWHNIWMARHGKQLAQDARQLGQDVVSGSREMSTLALVIALAVLREGSESVLFLYGLIAGGEETRATVLGGATIGLLFGAMAGYGLYAGLLRIPARLFFSVTSGFILLLAAAMSSQAARFLVQADLLSSLANPLWNTSWLLDNSSLLGRLLHTIVGYEATPSGIQVVFYSATLLLILAGMHIFRYRPNTLASS
ncbi:FTR1 family protein [Propionivibrio sp.]|uniref:FTR1 family iron permease n=1 Tax=Propionivibrio sp. TaxID=2212460 RepID=UPI0025F8DFF5|nr:FTR1 family protein [Propionivibrio sp.]MBK7355432.1 FTR1 family protein [Propionivibrio sp.]MBK8401824.1 FTR1 family protein [Propionivibrio sp.]MBK8744434.1 FTR1 family protein [Propionivibrio sp.]MBK8895081.1 FTR1 family protein [Propionivibrio sp.]MBL0208798.1 FTR1 family protein [Propionivibrio sp.]